MISIPRGKRQPPPVARPYHQISDSSQEMTVINGITRQVYRQIGWLGFSGAMYSLNENPRDYEFAGFSPVWVVAHSDVIEPERVKTVLVNEITGTVVCSDGRRFTIDDYIRPEKSKTGARELVYDGDIKTLRETLCFAQSCVAQTHNIDNNVRLGHMDRLQELIYECVRHRPLGNDGKHGSLHTETCGCEDK